MNQGWETIMAKKKIKQVVELLQNKCAEVEKQVEDAFAKVEAAADKIERAPCQLKKKKV